MNEESPAEKAKRKFLVLKRAVRLHKAGKYTDSELLHFLAGFCGYAPHGDENKLLETFVNEGEPT